MNNVWFVSDTHFGHEKILSFGQRQFPTIGEHDQALIDNWNDTVRSDKDVVWHLGDVSLGGKDRISAIGKCNGRKKLILGNHDLYGIDAYLPYFDEVYGVCKRYGGMVLSHVPVHPSQLEYRWRANVHGHIHRPEEYDLGDGYVNVCLDAIGLRPIHLDEVKAMAGLHPELLGEQE